MAFPFNLDSQASLPSLVTFRPPEDFDDDMSDGETATAAVSTPERVKKVAAHIAGGALIVSPSKEEKEEIDAHLAAIGSKSTPERKRIAHELTEVAQQALSKKDPATSEYHEEAAGVLKAAHGLSATGGRIMGKLSHDSTPARVIPFSHLTELNQTSGFHLPEDDSHSINIIAINPATKVRYALIDGKKHSSLFPEGTNRNSVSSYVTNGTTVAKSGNKILKQSRDYMIECYKNSEMSYSSVFPIFFYAEFDPSREYLIMPEFSIFAGEVMTDAQKLLQSGADHYEISDLFGVTADHYRPCSFIQGQDRHQKWNLFSLRLRYSA